MSSQLSSSGSVSPRGSPPLSSRRSPRREPAPTASLPQTPSSPYPRTIDPSPVDSVGTASTGVTDIEEEEEVDAHASPANTSPAQRAGLKDAKGRWSDSPAKLDIPFTAAARSRSGSGATPQSAIRDTSAFPQSQPLGRRIETPPQLPTREKPSSFEERRSPIESSARTIVSQNSSPDLLTTGSPRSVGSIARKSVGSVHGSGNSDRLAKRRSMAYALDLSRLPVQNLTPERYTPVAQTRAEVEEEAETRGRRSFRPEEVSRAIGESGPDSGANSASQSFEESDQSSDGFGGLKNGFDQCWTLCNTLAQLSSRQRQRSFEQSDYTDVQDHAWRSCWQLCQGLYESRESTQQIYVLPTLEMCRAFCQALFEARQRPDESTDSVWRVLWELQNHLYNTHERSALAAVQERTLEFYIALCHRLMKQRTSLPEDTEALLRACWSLAEVLFNMRQVSKQEQTPSEELLGMAVQACWELCDLFRQGWTQDRLDIATPTPRPSQNNSFSGEVPVRGFASIESRPSSTAQPRYSDSTAARKGVPPETPTTIFEDNPMDTLEEPNAPNIMVLGPETRSASSARRWPSSVSAYSESSSHQTVAKAAAQEPALGQLMNVRVLLVKAAMNAGFQPPRGSHMSSSSSNTDPAGQRQQIQQQRNQALLAFAKAMPRNSFGSQAWQVDLVEHYRRLLAAWPILVNNLGGGSAPSESTALWQKAGQRRTAAQIAVAVQWMARFEQYAWLGNLFRVVFGASPDEAESTVGDFVVQV